MKVESRRIQIQKLLLEDNQSIMKNVCFYFYLCLWQTIVLYELIIRIKNITILSNKINICSGLVRFWAVFSQCSKVKRYLVSWANSWSCTKRRKMHFIYETFKRRWYIAIALSVFGNIVNFEFASVVATSSKCKKEVNLR